jgi:hypothetical protein
MRFLAFFLIWAQTLLLSSCTAGIVGEISSLSYELFTSSQQYSSGVFGSIASMDTQCQTLANGAGLKLRYRALADASGARVEDRFDLSFPVFVRIQGQGATLFATNLGAALRGDETIAFTPRYDETGSFISGGFANVATGLTTSGVSGANCSDWTASTTMGVGTISNVTDWAWGGLILCANTVRIYCLGD